jgi:hypothetical protein
MPTQKQLQNPKKKVLMNQSTTEIISNEIIPLVKQCDWESPKPGEELYSTNQLIAAYEAGIARGMVGAQKLVQEKFFYNVDKTAEDTGKLVSKLQEYGINPSAARLKVISWDQFEVLIILPEKEYLDEKFDIVYNFVGELENATHEEFYCITFKFLPETENTDVQKIMSDGFTLLHKSLVK